MLTLGAQELLKIMSRRLKENDPEEDIREAFQVFDKENKGVLVKDLRHAMKSIGTLCGPSRLSGELCLVVVMLLIIVRLTSHLSAGEKVTDAEIDEMLKEVGVNKDGKITLKEFLKVLPPKK